MCSEPKYRACPKIFQGSFPQDSLIFLPLLLINPCYAAGFDNTHVDSRSMQLFYLCLQNFSLQVQTGHGTYFDISIISFTNALAGGGVSNGKILEGHDCLRYATGFPLVSWILGNVEGVIRLFIVVKNQNCQAYLGAFFLFGCSQLSWLRYQVGPNT